MLRLGYIVGSISSTSINRKVAQAVVGLAPDHVEFVELAYRDLPFYTPDADADYPAVAREWKRSIESVDGVSIFTPEYMRSIPGVLKNALDWASRPWGKGSFSGKPVAIAGASAGPIGTAPAQQHLRAILGNLNAPTLGQPEAFLRFNQDDFGPDGAVSHERTRAMLGGFLTAAIAHVELYEGARATADSQAAA